MGNSLSGESKTFLYDGQDELNLIVGMRLEAAFDDDQQYYECEIIGKTNAVGGLQWSCAVGATVSILSVFPFFFSFCYPLRAGFTKQDVVVVFIEYGNEQVTSFNDLR
jgi:hypothetical protein